MREIWKDGVEREVIRENGRFISWEVVPEEPLFWRVSLGLNFMVGKQYYGSLVQEWFETEEEALAALPRLKGRLIGLVEDFVEYPMSEWWFPVVIGEGVQEVPEWSEPYEDVHKKAA